MTTWSIAPVIDWLMRKGRHITSPEEPVGELCAHVRAGAGLPTFAYGVGLHLGRVLYGNIGTLTRLEFSVIGAAANETARIESLCKETGRDVVASGGVTEALGERWESLGAFELRGVGRAIEVYAMPPA